MLKNVFIIFGFFYGIFVITALHLFMGRLKQRCVDKNLGIEISTESYCSDNFSCEKN